MNHADQLSLFEVQKWHIARIVALQGSSIRMRDLLENPKTSQAVRAAASLALARITKDLKMHRRFCDAITPFVSCRL